MTRNSIIFVLNVFLDITQFLLVLIKMRHPIYKQYI